MPVYDIDLSDGRTVTVESDTDPTEEQVLGALQSFREPEAPSFAPSLPQEEIVQKYFGAPTAAPIQAPPPLFDESMRQVPMRTTTGTTPTPMMAYDLPPEERRAQFKEDILIPAVPLPRFTIDPKESPVTAAGKEAVNVLIGVPEFVETPAGILSFGAAAIAPIVTAGGFTVDMLYNLGKQIKTAYANWDKMTPAEKTVAVVDMAGTGAFAALTGTAAGRGIQRRLEPPQMKATRELAKVLETTEPLGTVQPRQPIRQLGIPQAALTAEPFLQPGIPELAGQALREAQSPLTIPGRTPAIEMLRQELAPPEVVPVETRLAGRIPERGGTMVTPTLEGVQVQPRVLRSASDILLERFVGREPMAAQPLPIPPEVQAAGKKAEAPVAPAKAPLAKPSEAPKVEPEIARGDTILWRPKNAREARVQGDVQGVVVEVIRNPDGDIGYEILAPLEGDPGRVLRVWAERGNVEVKARAPVEEKPPQVQPSGIGETGTVQRRKSVVEIADEIAKQGVDPQASYGLFVKERQLKPEIDAKEWLPIYKNSLELEKLRKQIEVTKRFSQQPTPSAKVEAPPATPLSDALRKFEDTGEIETVRDLVDEVDAMIGEGTAPESLQTAVKAFRDAVREDFEMAGRSDLEAAENAFLQAVRAKAGKTKAAPEAPPAKPAAAKVDVSSITKAKTEDEMLKATGELMRTAKTADEIAQVQEAAKAWTAPPAEPPGAPREMRPEPITPPTSDKTNILLRDWMQKASDLHEESRFMNAGKGIAVGAGGFDAWIKAETISNYLSNIRRGLSPDVAAENTKAWARQAIETHNQKRPKDLNWKRWEGNRDSQIEQMQREFNQAIVGELPKGISEAAAPDLISKLESLKLPETGAGNTFSLPHPDAIKAIGRSTWNTAIDVAIASVKAGKAIAQAVDDAIAYLRKNVRGLDEARARANLEYIAREETQPTVQIPSTEGETIKMRKSAERATTSPMVPEPVQERIAKAPESFYPQQVMKRVEEVVGDMTDQNLAAVPKDSNLYTASRLELARRLFERNDNEAGYRVFEDLEREGTRMGQLINQFKLLKGTRPENVVRVINEKLKREGKDVLNEKQRQEALEKATVSKQKDAVLDKATSDWQQNPTVENAAIAEKALLESHQAAVDLQRFVSRFSPRSTASILKSILQGSLLTPISEWANIFGNMSFIMFREQTRATATAFDILDNALTQHPREITVQPIAGTAEALKGLGRGIKQIPAIFRYGTGDVIKGETRAGLHPVQAWINQFSSNPEMPTTGGKLTLQDRVNLAIEGTFGVPAEMMLRGLGAGDVPFKEAARARVTATELRLANVPRDQWSFAQKFPEFFLSEAAMERVQAETMAAVFQRSSRTLNYLTNAIKGKGEIFDFFVATVAPYKLTPWNIIGETLSFNPLVAFGRTLYELKQGNRRAAKTNAAKYVVGSMITAAGWWLYSKGLMSPSLDERDETQKARVAAGEVIPPNHINLSGLKRAMAGGDPAFKPGDETVDVFRAGGLAGSMFYMTANIGRDFERRPDVPSSEIWLAILRQSTLEQARFGLNQSFLSGVEGLLTAIKEGNTENYVQKWANTVTSIPLPNSFTVLSRATREYKPDFREEGFWKQMENVFRNKLGWAGMDDYLPLKRDLWGEPIPETPEGRNAIIYHFFDITKNRQVTSDPAKLELFRLWRKTADNQVFPSLPERQITVQSKNYPLNSEQYSRYAELVGKERKRIFNAVAVNPQFHKLSDEAKVAGLDRIYRAGLDAGKAKFWKERGSTLTPKPPRAGFAPAP